MQNRMQNLNQSRHGRPRLGFNGIFLFSDSPLWLLWFWFNGVQSEAIYKRTMLDISFEKIRGILVLEYPYDFWFNFVKILSRS